MFVIVSVIAFVAIVAIVIAKSAKSVPAGSDKPDHKKDCGCDGNCNCKPKETMAYPLTVDPSVSPIPSYIEVPVETEEPKAEVIVEAVETPKVEEPAVEEPKAEEPKIEEPKAEKKKAAKKPAKKSTKKDNKGKGKKK